MGKEANADQSRPVICDQNASNLESDELQSSTQTAITANATKITNTNIYEVYVRVQWSDGNSLRLDHSQTSLDFMKFIHLKIYNNKFLPLAITTISCLIHIAHRLFVLSYLLYRYVHCYIVFWLTSLIIFRHLNIFKYFDLWSLTPIAQRQTFGALLPGPGLEPASGMAIEAILTFNLLFVALCCTDPKHKTVIHSFPIAFCIGVGIMSAVSLQWWITIIILISSILTKQSQCSICRGGGG